MYKDKFYPKPAVNGVYSIAETVDDFLDAVVGLRPCGHLLEIGEKLAPANVINELTGIPKPSEVIDETLEDIYLSTERVFRRDVLRPTIRRRW